MFLSFTFPFIQDVKLVFDFASMYFVHIAFTADEPQTRFNKYMNEYL
jgi:hypothetical protein